MNFSTFTKISSGNLIYFRNEAPIENVGTLKFYKDNSSGTFLKKEFRWSFDRNYWSSWETLNIGNIAKVNTGNNRYLFFEIKYTMTSPTAGKVTSFAVEYILNPNETYAPAVEDVTNMDNNHILPDGCNDLGGTTKTFKTIEITDAETLCGKSCDYYLWRPNHKGTQPISSVEGLQNILNNLTSGLNDSITNALNVDGSGTGVFYQKSGKNLIFKKINPGAGSYIIESDGIITIGVDASLSAKDPSINDLYNLFYQLDTNLSDASIYIDYKFLQIDASLADLYAKDASIDDLRTDIGYLESSIAYLDSSIQQLFDRKDTSVLGAINIGDGSAAVYAGITNDGSLQFRELVGVGAATVTQNGDLIEISIDASFAGEVIARLDASINQLWTYVDGSITQLWDYLDSSFSGQFVKESSLGASFYWDASGLLDVSVSGGSFSGDVSTSHVFYDPALDPSLAMPNSVGGIPAGTTVYDLQGDSLRSILNDLLFPTVNPTYVAPSGSFNDNVANLQEIGAMINPQFTASFSRGQILVSGNFQDYRSGLPNQYVFTDASANTLLIDASSTSLSNIQTVNNYLVKIGTQSFTSRIYYDAGPQPYDNKGNPYGTPLSAGSVGPYSTSFEGVYPLFATTSNITTLTQQTLVSMLTGNNIAMTLVAESGGNKQKFEIPTAWTGVPTSRSLVAVQQFNTVSSTWEYPGGSAASSLALWTTSSVTESVQGNTINYTQYTYNGTDRGSVQIRLVF